MNCIYCDGATSVENSRGRTRPILVWRRRKCKVCFAQFTTYEEPSYASSIMIVELNGQLSPLKRDRLLLELYKALGHRKDALDSASELTNTILGILIKPQYSTNQEASKIDLKTLSKTTYEVLKRFDPMAAYAFRAYNQDSLN